MRRVVNAAAVPRRRLVVDPPEPARDRARPSPRCACVRADFPYRLAGRKAPDRPPVLLQAVRDAAKPLRRGGLVLGGRSMGGRICSLAVGDAEDPLPAKALVLICYPLHPPGKPDTLRVEHFPRLHVPCLFISGTRDAFGTPDELHRSGRRRSPAR